MPRSHGISVRCAVAHVVQKLKRLNTLDNILRISARRRVKGLLHRCCFFHIIGNAIEVGVVFEGIAYGFSHAVCAGR